MALVIEDGTGLSTAQAYVAPDDALVTSYIAGHLYASAWEAAPTPRKEAALAMAARTIDANFGWSGYASTDDQALSWPRTKASSPRGGYFPHNKIPDALKRATVEMAIALLRRDRTDDTATTAGVESLGLGDGAIELKFGAGDSASASVDIIPPIVAQMLAGFAATTSSGSGMRKVYRA